MCKYKNICQLLHRIVQLYRQIMYAGFICEVEGDADAHAYADGFVVLDAGMPFQYFN